MDSISMAEGLKTKSTTPWHSSGNIRASALLVGITDTSRHVPTYAVSSWRGSLTTRKTLSSIVDAQRAKITKYAPTESFQTGQDSTTITAIRNTRLQSAGA